jgi:hypothetical protein
MQLGNERKEEKSINALNCLSWKNMKTAIEKEVAFQCAVLLQ